MSSLSSISALYNNKVRSIAKRFLLFTFLFGFCYAPLRAAISNSSLVNPTFVKCLDHIIKTRKGKKCLSPNLYDRHEAQSKDKMPADLFYIDFTFPVIPEVARCQSSCPLPAVNLTKERLYILYPKLRI